VKAYRIRVDYHPTLCLYAPYILAGRREACLSGDYFTARAARKAAKDFIKQLKEAEAKSESLQTREECEKQGIKFATDEDLREI